MRWKLAAASLSAVAVASAGGLAAGTAVAPPVSAVQAVQVSQDHAAHQAYYAEGTIRLVKEPHYCLTYPINPIEGAKVFWYPCTTYKGKPLPLQMWYTEKVLGVGSISMWGYPWVMGKSHTNSDLYARVWKLAEQPKMKFYTTLQIINHGSEGYQVWIKLGDKVFVLSGPKNMNDKTAKRKPYYATFTNGSDLHKRWWGIEFRPDFKPMDSVAPR